ncbi:MAG: Ig-like domain-containing protein [Muribaculaceae bacterium]|nr:Ig-like domain-containing protein [Muribaculaceae bacterium]
MDWSGEGTPGDPYLISTPAELAGMAKRVNAGETFEGVYFRLTAELYLSNPDMADDKKPLWEPIGMKSLQNGDVEENPGGFYNDEHWFKGNFDGAGFAIHDLWYAHDSEFEENFNDPFNDTTYDFEGWYKALFGSIDGATISNLKLVNPMIQCEAKGAALVCTAINSVLSGITVEGGSIACGSSETMGGQGGGIVCEATGSTITGCASSASVKSVSSAGVLAGSLASTTVRDCSAAGRAAAIRNAGGFVGFVSDGSLVENCSAASAVVQLSGKRTGSDIGGFVGTISGGTVRLCSASGSLTVSGNGAGFCGTVWMDGLIESSYSTCNISKDGYEVWMASFVGNIGSYDPGDLEWTPGRVRNCFGVSSYSYQPIPSGMMTTGNHIGGFANSISETSQAANCFYNSDTATGINTISSAEDGELPLPNEFGLTTAYMQSEAFVSELNRMAAVMGASLWQYRPGQYPVPTGVIASVSDSPFGGGAGSASDPFVVSEKEHLVNLADITNHGWDFIGQYFLQAADIALNAPMEEWGEEMPELWTPIALPSDFGNSFRFCGNYDGGYHSVSNMYLDNNVKKYAGFFGVIGDGATISRLGVTDAFVVMDSGYAGILAGSAALWNDSSNGTRNFSECWTSGHIEGFSTSGLLGSGSQWGRTNITNCYTTAEIQSSDHGGAFFAQGIVGDMPIYLSASYFAGKFIPNGYGRIPDPFNECVVENSYFSFEGFPTDGLYEHYSLGRTEAYMKSPEFVNQLTYASSVAGVDVSPWRYTQGSLASFSGLAPTVDVMFVVDSETTISTKAISGSLIVAPDVQIPDGLSLRGWYDVATGKVFDFALNRVKAPIALEAKWEEVIVPDYTPFKNRFTKTYTIKTPAQLYAFANIVNGKSQEVDQTYFDGYTIRLGNDIELNDSDDFDSWGQSVRPKPFSPIGNGSFGFAGIFDGQGYSISGLYINETMGSSTFGMFTSLDQAGSIKNVVLKNALVEVGFTQDNPTVALLVGYSKGTVYRCGAEGKILITGAAQDGGYVGGLVGEMNVRETALLSECYALVEASLKKQGFGGLVYLTKGDIENCFARTDVQWEDYGRFGGIVCNQNYPYISPTHLTNSWCESSIDWKWAEGVSAIPGGAAYGDYNAENKNVFYDKTSLDEAFGPVSSSWTERTNPYLMGSPLSSFEMTRMASFTGFDFETTWGRRADINVGKPYLRWTAPGLDNDTDPEVPVESIAIDPASLTLGLDETVQLVATVLPEIADNKTLEWTSSDEGVALVDENGFVECVSEGLAVITARATDGSGVAATCELHVKLSSGVEGVAVDAPVSVQIINLQGVILYEGPLAESCLTPGIYIIRHSDGHACRIRIK